MTEETFGITQFVRGMAWHDVGKPFHLGTGGHIWLGYWLLTRAGYRGEALIAMTHGGGEWSGLKKVLKAWFGHQGNPLPAVLLLANPLDRISASVYSLLARTLDLKGFLGRKGGLEERNPLFHSWQNPFSRLPMPGDDLGIFQGGRFLVRESYDEAKVPHHRVEQLDRPLRAQLVERLPEEWTAHIKEATLDSATKPEHALKAAPAPADGRALLGVLESFLRRYPERTYPPANDTTLMEHGRLSGALAFVLYRNLEQKAEGWISGRIRQSDGEFLVDTQEEVRPVREYLKAEEGWGEAQRVACSHLDARLVRVAFEGHRELFEGAVRVDDLLGARALTQRFLDAFEVALAQVLGVPGLVWSSEEDERRSLLTLNRGQFDLFYLLPPHPDADGGMSVEEAIDLAYEQALGTVVEDLMGSLKQDFRRAVRAGRLSFGPEEAQALRRQLRALGYRLRVLDLQVPSEGRLPDSFATFTSQYGNALVKRFRESQAYAQVPPGDLPIGPGAGTGEAPLPPDETCDVCGNHPIFQPFAALLEDETWGPYVRKAVHHFRGEPERPCLACIARRILAHGAVARETEDVLQRMVVWADGEAERPRRLAAVQPEEGPELPPAMVAGVRFADDDDFVDLGAAFARYRRRADGGVDHKAPPELFPTIGYAADGMGNAVLLALQPTGALYETYSYAQVADGPDGLPQEVVRGDRAPETDEERWQASFTLLYRWVKEHQTQELAENMVTVHPHLARVMERIRHVRTFYRALKEALEDVPLRVLPLDTDFPTLRLLLPAAQLDQALGVLDRVMTETLFSATYLKALEERRRSHELLKLLVPDLLHGAVVLFKQKFPLYLALEAERALFHHLAATDRREENGDRPSSSDWYGLRMAFTDLRGTLSQTAPVRAEVAYADLGDVLDLAEGADRRTVLLRAEAKEYISPELADALTIIRARRVGLHPERAEALQREEIFPPVLFLKRATRR